MAAWNIVLLSYGFAFVIDGKGIQCNGWICGTERLGPKSWKRNTHKRSAQLGLRPEADEWKGC